MERKPQHPEGGEQQRKELEVQHGQGDEPYPASRSTSFEYGYLSPIPPEGDSWDEWVIERGIEAALREGRSIDDRTAHYIAAQLHEGQTSALYSLASTGHISPDIDAELARGFDQQTDQARRWIRWLGGYCALRPDRGSVPGWTDMEALRTAQREQERDWLDSLFGEQPAEEVGSVDELGWFGLVRHEGRPGGIVLHQDEQGFRHVWETDSQRELEDRWAGIGGEYEGFQLEVEKQAADEQERGTEEAPADRQEPGQADRDGTERAELQTTGEARGNEDEEPYIPELAPDYGGEGYDWLERLPDGWKPVAAWGREGWDLGDWPYAIVVEYRDPGQGVYAVGTYVENDITVQRFETVEEQSDAIDKIAEFYWRLDPARGPSDLPTGQGLLPHHRRPYQRSRADERE
jgi:hypothetical protein